MDRRVKPGDDNKGDMGGEQCGVGMTALSPAFMLASALKH